MRLSADVRERQLGDRWFVEVGAWEGCRTLRHPLAVAVDGLVDLWRPQPGVIDTARLVPLLAPAMGETSTELECRVFAGCVRFLSGTAAHAAASIPDERVQERNIRRSRRMLLDEAMNELFTAQTASGRRCMPRWDLPRRPRLTVFVELAAGAMSWPAPLPSGRIW